ncbi:histidine--tRNA ligase [Vallitalea okinawensis]|uniref:histidine--tRNA ligase n=1 Tax=Vallitalea okinawensis TaxID=2078660 RepID=UPI000CFB22CB|nr:histidine--tRNA ligase [Vallitalea okinawensis]
MITKAPRGTQDLYGDQVKTWRKVEQVIRKLTEDFGFEEIRTPMFEHTELFQRGVGETTDIVQKEMYSFKDKGDRDITLKPEGTAGVARAFLENKLFAGAQPTKLYYITPAFRYERPQAGRFRQFHQFGVELFGSEEPAADAEVIAIAKALLDRVGINKVELHINSLGGPECRKKYNETLKSFIKDNLENLCPTCQERFEKNPLRTLDCKNEGCQEILKGAPAVLDVLDEECKAHFKKLQSILDSMGIAYIVDPNIVRGLDYYTRTVFEFISNDIGSQGTVCGGGRYDKLIEECGGKPMPAVGFGVGMERLVMVMKAEQGEETYKAHRDIYIGSLGDNAGIKSQGIIYHLRQAGISAEGDIIGRSVKAQMKYANKIGAEFSVILGDDEIEQNKATIKNMETGDLHEVTIDNFVEDFKKAR